MVKAKTDALETFKRFKTLIEKKWQDVNILGKMVVESIHPKNLKTTAVNMTLYINSHHHILHKHGKRNTMYKHGKRDTMYKHRKNHTKAKWINQNIWGK